MKCFKLLVLQILFSTGAFAQVHYYVSPAGSNSNGGHSSEQPFQTVQYAIDTMNEGDVLNVMDGFYSEAIELKSGITIKAMTPRNVTFSGAELLEASFVSDEGGVYKTPIGTKNIKQMFVDGNPMTWAQWPNMNWSQNWKNSKKWKSVTNGGPGFIKTDDFTELSDLNVTGGYCFIRYGKGNSCYSRLIKNLNVGNKRLKWNDDDFYDKKYTGEDGVRGSEDALKSLATDHDWHPNKSRFFLAGALDFLDSEGEWFVEGSDLYIYPPNGVDMNESKVLAKTLDYVIDENEKLTNIEIDGIDFFATSVKLEHNGNENIRFKNTHFNYIGGELLFIDRIHGDTISKPIRVRGGGIEFDECLFAGAQNGALSLEGDEITVRNCVFMENNRHCNFESRALNIKAKGYYKITKNTFFNNGSDAMYIRTQNYIGTSPEVSYNNVFNAGLYNSDVSGVYMPSKSQHYLNVDHNWVHNVHGNAIRLDLAGSELSVHHNVLWANVRGLNIEGYSKFNVYNNTSVHAESGSSFTRNVRSHFEPVTDDLADEIDDDFPPIKEWNTLNNIVEAFTDRVGPREVSYYNALVARHNERQNSKDIDITNRNKVKGNLIGGISNVFNNYSLNDLNLIPKNNANNTSSGNSSDDVQSSTQGLVDEGVSSLDNFRGAYDANDSNPWVPGSEWMPLEIASLNTMKKSQNFASDKKNYSYLPAVPTIDNYTLSVQEKQKSKELTISPNPVIDRFTIQLDKTEKSASLFIYSTTGKLLYQREYSKVSTIKLEGSVLTKGVNTLRVLTDKESYSAKLLKE